MELSHWTIRCEGVTFVSLVVANPHAEAARFRVANRLDGPVWPPRVTGRPEHGWDSDGYEGVLDPGAQAVLGYASPASPEEPAATIEWAEPADESPAGLDETRTARTHADPRPPRDVLSPVTSTVHEQAIDRVVTEPASWSDEMCDGCGGAVEPAESGGSQ